MKMGKNQKILLIDDFPDNVYTLKEILEEENFKVITAFEGATGIEMALTENPDFIICDVMMPEINGFQVLERLRENPKALTIPFIFLSAKSELQDIREGMKLGADDYITKPVNRKELLNTINLRLAKKDIYEKKLSELRKSISYSLPHELKTPLVSILGFSQIIKNDNKTLSSIEISEMSEIIYKSANSLNNLIQKIIFFTKLELITGDETQLQIFTSGSVKINNEVIQDVTREIADKYKRTGDLKIDIKKFDINIAQTNLKIIIEELVDNAFKFSKEKNEISITGSVLDNQYTFYIINNGYGMTNEQIAFIGGYFQADRMLYEQPGVGLGLTISKKIIELHSGNFNIESIPGKKTMISFTLPVKPL